jgi:hypothetical protein
MPVEPNTPAAEAGRLAAELEQWIEDFAAVVEGWGLPRMAGRIFGYLLVCDPPERSAAEIAAATGASRASISSMARFLIGQGLVERWRPLGSRADRYRAADDAAFALFELAIVQLATLHRTAESGVALLRERRLGGGERLAAFAEAAGVAEHAARGRPADWRA